MSKNKIIIIIVILINSVTLYSQSRYSLETFKYTTFINSRAVKHPITNENVSISISFGEYNPDGELVGAITTKYRGRKKVYSIKLYQIQDGTLYCKVMNYRDIKTNSSIKLDVFSTTKIKINNITFKRIQ